MDSPENAPSYPVFAGTSLKSQSVLTALEGNLVESLPFPPRETTFRPFFKRPAKKSRVLIIGAGWAGSTLAAEILKDSKKTFEIIGFIDDDPTKKSIVVNNQKVCSTSHRIKVIGSSQSLVSQVEHYKPNTIILAVTHQKSAKLLEALNECILLGYHITNLTSFYEHAFQKIAVEHLKRTPFLMDFQVPQKSWGSKILFDFIIPLIAVTTLFPLFLFTALAIKLTSKGPVLYRQRRVGKNGRPFTLYKFRTMIDGADRQGPHWTLKKDNRITKVGKIIRKFRLDEFPQLINVLKGNMSLIGPRPEAKSLVDTFKKEIPFYECRHFMKPGVTGWAQVNFGSTCSVEGALEKLQYDLFYLRKRCFLLDFSILLKTVRVVLNS